MIRQLIEKYAKSKHTIGCPIIEDNSVRLTGHHFTSLVSATATGKSAQRACIVCNHTSRRKRAHTYIAMRDDDAIMLPRLEKKRGVLSMEFK